MQCMSLLLIYITYIFPVISQSLRVAPSSVAESPTSQQLNPYPGQGYTARSQGCIDYHAVQLYRDELTTQYSYRLHKFTMI